MDAAPNEVKVVDGGYKVGDTTLMVNAARNVVTVTVNDEEQTTITGLMAGMNPMHTVPAAPGVEGVDGDPDGDPVAAYVAPMVGTAESTFSIGKTIDSAVDTARLMIVTAYAAPRR